MIKMERAHTLELKIGADTKDELIIRINDIVTELNLDQTKRGFNMSYWGATCSYTLIYRRHE